MARARIPDAEGLAALRAAREAIALDPESRTASTAREDADARALFAQGVPRSAMATAVRYSLQELAERARGNTVEVRVPPFGAVQCIEGPGHTRGTPPNVVETDAATWVALVTGDLTWERGVESGSIHASGQRADLRGHVPLSGL